MSRRRVRRLPAIVMVVIDVILINLAFAVSWWLRYELELGPEVAVEDYVTLDAYIFIELSLAGILLAVLGLQRLYVSRLGAGWMDKAGTIVGATTVAIAIVIVAVFGFRPYAYSRLIFLYAWALIIVFLVAARVLETTVKASMRKRGIGLNRLLVVGAGAQGRIIMQNLVAQPDLGYHVVGFVDDERTEDLARFKALGTLEQITGLIRTAGIDEVIIALPSASHRKIVEIMIQCERAGVGFRIVPDFYELSLSRVDIDEINGIPLIGVREGSIQGWNLMLKRMIDAAASFGVLLIFSPLIAVIALAIKLDSPGPILFTQTRVGREGKHFQFYKFRSMKVGADREVAALECRNEATGPLFKIRNDPRLTRVGKLLRRLSLDELPQFYNILVGDMSLVGPRPPIPREVEKYEDWHFKRLDAAPGLTGLWQVSGRSDLTFDEMVLLDIWYIENWSLGLDLKIMMRTIPAVLLARGAY
ncbi:MAG: undecaprenyl-phosphate glucose phosphotransferase [Chloroflexi bacterium]|nr:undecaprenyl-phosphate glucose phosphotransferase [Chloroflexota bacterium]